MRLGPYRSGVNDRRSWGAAALAAALLANGGRGAADDQVPSPGPGATDAKLLTRVIPEYPYAGRLKGREGWVDFSFVVRPEGTVADPIVENSSGFPEFERSALGALLKTTYQPATFNGQPIEQCATRIRYKFVIPGLPPGARKSFSKEFCAAADLVRNRQYDEAEAWLAEARKDGAFNFYESSRLSLLQAEIDDVRGNKEAQLQSLIRAEGGRLEPELYIDVLRRIFALELELKRYSDALLTHERMREKGANLAPDDPVEKAAAEINSIVTGPGVLGFPGRIEFRSGCAEGRPNFQHRLLRREFAVTDIQGKAQELEIRCNRKRFVDAVADDKKWAVPASWGFCQVFVFGDIGTTLKILEYPAATTATN